MNTFNSLKITGSIDTVNTEHNIQTQDHKAAMFIICQTVFKRMQYYDDLL